MKKTLIIIATFLMTSACVVHKSEHRKFFEENGHLYVRSQAFTFKISHEQDCPGTDPETMATRLAIESKNILTYTGLSLVETSEPFCLISTKLIEGSRAKSWICPTVIELSCWEHLY